MLGIGRTAIPKVDEFDAGGGRHGDGRRVLVVESHEPLAQGLTAAFRADMLDAAFAPDLPCEGVLRAAKAMQPLVVLLGLDAGGEPTLPLIRQRRRQAAEQAKQHALFDRSTAREEQLFTQVRHGKAREPIFAERPAAWPATKQGRLRALLRRPARAAGALARRLGWHPGGG